MREDLLNILSENNNEVDNQKLLDYLGGRLSDEEKHEVEKWMIDNSFFNEAVEGLQQAGGEKKVLLSVNDINKQLARYLKQKKARKAKKKLPVAATWTYVAIIVILLLTILIYLVVSKL